MRFIKERINQICCFFKAVYALAKNIFGKRESPVGDYHDLAPVNDVEDCEEHIKALQWALANPQIKNIALAGPYGSGKSSIINTFLERNLLLKETSIRISLANFAQATPKGGSKRIEEEVLKQLFYKVEQKKIPQSRYRKLHKVRFIPIFCALLACTAVAFVLFFIFRADLFDKCCELIVTAGAKINLLNWFSLVLFFLLVLAVLLGISRIFQLFACRLAIKEVKLPVDTTIAKKENTSESVFNKNMDEIAYFFEETSYDLIFIEDLDRFNNPSIFVQLRELNTLLNSYDAIKRKVVFVYAIKDDMFKDTERTKFFDFIIPVIPVINSTNSGEILMQLIKSKSDTAPKHVISESYILDVSPYISDMRVLQNIYNEFIIYKATLKTQQGLSTLIDELMMSLIIFKNLYPDQFAKLQNEHGIVKDAFKDKHKFIEKKIVELQEQRDEAIRILDRIKGDTLANIQEMKFAMLGALNEWKGIATKVRLNGGSQYTAEKILQNDFNMQNLLAKGTWYVSGVSTSGSSTGDRQINVSEICAPYVDRFGYLQSAGEENEENLKKKIENLEKQIHDISSLNLKELVNKYGLMEVITSSAVQENELLLLMLRKGYIDEKYVDYINFFKGNSITVEDMNFVLSVKNQKPKEFTYPLSESKMPQILSRLQLHEFDERSILNFALLEYMLSVHDHDEELNVFVGQLANETKDSWKFIDEFIDVSKYKKRFIALLATKWNGLWNDIYDNHILSYERKLYYLALICKYCDLESLSILNSDKLITKFFVEHEDILQCLPDGLAERIKQLVPELKISFYRLKVERVPSTILDFVFDGMYYELNSDMIRSVVEYKNPTLLNRLSSQNYTVVLELNYAPLLAYIHDNVELYIDQIVLTEENTKESTCAITELLSQIIKDAERCETLIRHEDFSLEAFSDACSDVMDSEKESVHKIWDLLLKYNKVQVSWKNIYEYWAEFGLTQPVLIFISQHADMLAGMEHAILDDDFKQNIIRSDIENEIFEKLLHCFEMSEFCVPLDEISVEKLATMVQHHYLRFDSLTYQELEKCAPELCVDFILQNQSDFQLCMDTISISDSVFEKLILSDRTELPVKENVVNLVGAELMTDVAATWISQANISNNKDVFIAVWQKLVDPMCRKAILFCNLQLLDANDFEMYLSDLESPYCNLNRTAYRHEEFILDTEENRALVKRLHEVQYLTSYVMETQKQGEKETSVIRCRIKAKSGKATPVPV